MTERKESSFDRFDKWWQAVVEPFFKKWGTEILIGVPASVALVLLGRHYCLNSSEWASWVQAVGSILAILAAIAIAGSQIRRQEKLEELRRQATAQRQRATVLALLEMVRSSAVVCRAVLKDYEVASAPTLRAISENIERSTLPLLNGPLWEFEDVILSQGLIRVSQSCNLLMAMLKPADPAKTAPMTQLMGDLISDCESTMSDVRSLIGDA